MAEHLAAVVRTRGARHSYFTIVARSSDGLAAAAACSQRDSQPVPSVTADSGEIIYRSNTAGTDLHGSTASCGGEQVLSCRSGRAGTSATPATVCPGIARSGVEDP